MTTKFALAIDSNLDSSHVHIEDLYLDQALKVNSNVDVSHISNEVLPVISLKTDSNIDVSNSGLGFVLTWKHRIDSNMDKSFISNGLALIHKVDGEADVDISTTKYTFTKISSMYSDTYTDRSQFSSVVEALRKIDTNVDINHSKFSTQISRLWITEPPEHDMVVVAHGKDKPISNNMFDLESLYGINVQLRDPRLSLKGTILEFTCRLSPYSENNIFFKTTRNQTITVKSVKQIGMTTMKEYNAQIALYPEDLDRLPKKSRLPIYYTLKVINGLNEEHVLEKGLFFVNTYSR